MIFLKFRVSALSSANQFCYTPSKYFLFALLLRAWETKAGPAEWRHSVVLARRSPDELIDFF